MLSLRLYSLWAALGLASALAQGFILLGFDVSLESLVDIDPGSSAFTAIESTSVPDPIEGMALEGTTARFMDSTAKARFLPFSKIPGAASALPNTIGASGLWRGLAWEHANQQLLATLVGGGTGGVLQRGSEHRLQPSGHVAIRPNQHLCTRFR